MKPTLPETTPDSPVQVGPMKKPFEELVAAELDTLYAGALYLEAGDRRAAGDLLVQTVLGAGELYAEGDPRNLQDWFDERLVRTFLGLSWWNSAPSGDPETGREVGSGSTATSNEQTGESERMLQAFGALPPRIRSTMWLVVVRRWAYGDVARVLDTDRHRVAHWVRQGHRRILRAGAHPTERGTYGS